MDKEMLGFIPTGLLIGVEEIDIQHAELFRKLMLLKESFVRDGGILAAEADGLLQALRQHYAAEEQLASEIGMDFVAHTESHRSMLQLISKALHDGVEGRADVAGTLRYIDYWFERHIAQDDMTLGKCALRWQVQNQSRS